MRFPKLANATTCLHDIDAARLRTSEIIAHKLAESLSVHPTIQSTLDRRASLDGADYAINGHKAATVSNITLHG